MFIMPMQSIERAVARTAVPHESPGLGAHASAAPLSPVGAKGQPASSLQLQVTAEARAAASQEKPPEKPPQEPISVLLLQVLHSVWRASTGVIDASQAARDNASSGRSRPDSPLVYSVSKTRSGKRS